MRIGNIYPPSSFPFMLLAVMLASLSTLQSTIAAPSSEPALPAAYKSAPFVNADSLQKSRYTSASSYKSYWPFEKRTEVNDGTRGNQPIPIPDSFKPAVAGISLRVTEEPALTSDGKKGVCFYLLNASAQEQEIRAEDGDIKILQEALDPQGRWRPIETWKYSFCGNSYHSLFLPSNQAWKFTAPRYAGNFKTKLRFVFKNSIYSQPFEGSINLTQFDPAFDDRKPVEQLAGNYAKPVSPAFHARPGNPALPDSLSLVLTDKPVLFNSEYQGRQVLLTNTTDTSVAFETVNHSLRLFQQARDERGDWHTLDAPISTASDSTPTTHLPPGHALSLVCPRYSGRFKTNMRFVLERTENGVVVQHIFSPEFEGRVNPSWLEAPNTQTSRHRLPTSSPVRQ